VNRHERRLSNAVHGRNLRGSPDSWEPFALRPDAIAKAKERGGNLANLVAFYANNRYSVQVYERRGTAWGDVQQLLVRRHDEEPIRSWTDLQRIKNEIAGPERVAVEVFPAQRDVIDQANCLHLWVLPVGFHVPFTLRGEWR
jgi:hypothetical protein